MDINIMYLNMLYENKFGKIDAALSVCLSLIYYLSVYHISIYYLSFYLYLSIICISIHHLLPVFLSV